MPILNAVKHNFFRDSIQLMRLTEDAKKLPGVVDAVVAMGTDTNKLLLQQLGLIQEEGKAAGDGDLVLAVSVASGSNAEDVMANVERLVMSPPSASAIPGQSAETYYSIESALEHAPGADLAIVSLPGSQAFEPTMELLRNGINVHLFSDHVSREDEAKLKGYAHSNGLLVLGPGAGTTLIGGVGLGFANAVKRGSVGVVASAGTGLQEVSVLLDRVGLGISHGLGVGGSDVSKEIGGLMMKDCLGLLERDRGTKIVMIVAKIPTAKVMQSVIGFAKKNMTKQVVACFLGLDAKGARSKRIHFAMTLHSAASEVSKISGPRSARWFEDKISINMNDVMRRSKRLSSVLSPGQKFVRGLYSGGTLAHETLLVYRELIGEAFSNTPLSKRYELEDPTTSRQNTILDLGDEFFTAGRPHPMIDPTLRRLRISQEASDPSVAVILMDVVLGHGAASDPGGSLIGAIGEARNNAKNAGRELLFMAHVCGTNADPQSLKDQSEKLSRADVVLFPSNAQMAIVSALVVGGGGAGSTLKRKWRNLLGES
jgi:FdrA protein